MRVRRAGSRRDKTALQMTAMIDIVFLLLVFFILTFKIVAPEGDFNIRMPLAAPPPGPPTSSLPPIQVRLVADDSGQLAAIRMNDVPLQSLEEVRTRLIDLIGHQPGPGSQEANAEVELDCDYTLKYDYVMQAITAVSGYVTDDKQVVKLIEKIKFASPKKPG